MNEQKAIVGTVAKTAYLSEHDETCFEVRTDEKTYRFKCKGRHSTIREESPVIVKWERRTIAWFWERIRIFCKIGGSHDDWFPIEQIS